MGGGSSSANFSSNVDSYVPSSYVKKWVKTPYFAYMAAPYHRGTNILFVDPNDMDGKNKDGKVYVGTSKVGTDREKQEQAKNLNSRQLPEFMKNVYETYGVDRVVFKWIAVIGPFYLDDLSKLLETAVQEAAWNAIPKDRRPKCSTWENIPAVAYKELFAYIDKFQRENPESVEIYVQILKDHAVNMFNTYAQPLYGDWVRKNRVFRGDVYNLPLQQQLSIFVINTKDKQLYETQNNDNDDDGVSCKDPLAMYLIIL